MANGPLGGFMPTPPSPGQPPQVKLETSAESRGTFNKFLGTLPKNGAIAPIQTGVMSSSTAPVSPMTDNVNIFQPQMSQMAPMPMPAPMSMPMMPMTPSGRPVQNFFSGGEIDSFVDDSDGGNNFSSGNDNDDNYESFVGDDPDFSYNPDTGGFDVADRPDVSDNEQQQNIQDSQTFIDTPFSAPSVIDTRGRTNIRNVGARSNLRYDPQFTANLLQQRGLDPQGFMAPSDFSQTTQGGGSVAAPTLSSGLPSFGTGTDFLRERELAKLRPQASVSPVDVNPLSIPLAPTTGDFYGDLLDDPLGLGFNTAGLIDSNRAAQQMRSPENFQQIARLPTVVPGAGGSQDIPGLRAFGGFGDPVRPVGSIEDDLIAGRGKGANINNPGNIRSGGGFDGEIGETRDGFAIFDNLQSGVNAINTLTNTYGAKRNIDTVEDFAKRYSPVGRENTPTEVAGKIQVLSNALNVFPDEKVDFTDPDVQAKLTPALMTTEIGRNKTDDVLNILSGFSPSPLARDQTTDFNPNITSDPNQLGSLDPIGRTASAPNVEPEAFDMFGNRMSELTGQKGISIGNEAMQQQVDNSLAQDALDARGDLDSINYSALSPAPVDEGIVPVGEFDVRSPAVGEATDRGGRFGRALANDFLSARRMPGTAVDDFLNPATVTQNISPENTAARIARNNRTINEIRADLGSRVPDTALETLADRRDRSVQGPPKMPDTVLDIDTTFDPITLDDRLTTISPDILSSIGREQRIDDANTFRSTVPDAAKIFGGRQIQTTPIDFASVVGDDVEPELDVADIVGDITQERVADILNRPDQFKETFKIGDTEFPNLIATLANKAGSFFDRRLFDGIVSKGLDAVVDPDTGRIIGAKDEFGNLIEGRDLERFEAGDDNEDPIKRFLRKATEEKDEDDMIKKPPNQIGGGVPDPVRDPVPTVVKSKFPESTASFTPVDFDGGNLNDLIAKITGVPAPRTLQEGGVVNAVDNFLTKVA